MKRDRDDSVVGTPNGKWDVSPHGTLGVEAKEFERSAVRRYVFGLVHLKNEGPKANAVDVSESIVRSFNERFRRIVKIGQGSFGEVYIVFDTVTQTHLTMKRMQLLRGAGRRVMGLCNTTSREMNLLRVLKHVNIVELFDYHVVPDGTLIMLMPVIAYDLVSLIRLWRNGGPRGEPSAGRMPLPTIKCIFRQLLTGLAYLHKERVIHRDLKPTNVMINEKGVVKIIDFGWARFCPARWRGPMTGPPCPVAYRPPEVLLGGEHAVNYDASVDLWCCGCILFEMLSGGKMFINARSEAEAVAGITDWLGSPSSKSTLYYGHSAVSLIRFKQNRPSRLAHRCELLHIDRDSVDMLDKMLQLEPKWRMPAEELLRHRWFSSAPVACEPHEISLPEHNMYRWLDSRRPS
ncbi:protein kinase [Trypanosoma cruzi Dm28c]|uniref:Protein kinase n=2 Tax=Trypanosoma cruzi TaxID=5693 RepID=V5BW58_TRYCR|nr:protein kinase [Trypanosoma cruzi Dm28c]KAF8281295.1 putative cdc2-related kinase 8 [Trypanosoma cruzi]PBJ74103.1 protein kinase,cyclin-dependent protein kinase [Trypanosoma cruzi cruzi]PWU88642.1 putative cdc2-related kinase 8 [Trypanosoma cruzi]